MKISVIAPRELDDSHRAQWLQLQAASPVLANPCFSHEFTEAAGCHADARVAILEQDGRVVGFFPFRRRWGMGSPVAGRFTDHQGVIAAPQTRWNWSELLRGCGLGYWYFDHLAAAQRPPIEVVHATSPGLDLSDGFAAYRQRRIDSGSKRLAKLERSARKLAKDLGPLRFEAHSRDPAVLATVMRLKSEQCLRHGAEDCFAPPWAREMVERIAAIDNPAFGGRLSALHAGDTLVAAHFGMRSRQVWHWWFPVYNHEHASYSPGSLLLLRVAELAAEQGHSLLELGKGDEPYKAVFSDCRLPLVEGCVTRPSSVAYLRKWRKGVGHWLRHSPAAEPVRPLLRHLGRLH